jgi:Asp-tRNA(Asn)/Glu-tRNA(Gln) amidotransferase C subunit
LDLKEKSGYDTRETRRQSDPVDALSWVSRIGIEDKEKDRIKTAFRQAENLAQKITAIAEKISDDTDKKPLYCVLPSANRFREGTAARVSRFAKNGQLLKNSPAVKGQYFKVSPVLE